MNNVTNEIFNKYYDMNPSTSLCTILICHDVFENDSKAVKISQSGYRCHHSTSFRKQKPIIAINTIRTWNMKNTSNCKEQCDVSSHNPRVLALFVRNTCVKIHSKSSFVKCVGTNGISAGYLINCVR